MLGILVVSFIYKSFKAISKINLEPGESPTCRINFIIRMREVENFNYHPWLELTFWQKKL